MSQVLAELQAATGFFNEQRRGYYRAFLTRKIIIARLYADGEASLKSDWRAVDRDRLCEISADQNGYLSHFPASMSVSDISDLVFERCGMGMFVSMWDCQWYDVVPLPDDETQKNAQTKKKRKNTTSLETLLRFLKSGQYQCEALAARQRRGFWLCPWLIVQACKAC